MCIAIEGPQLTEVNFHQLLDICDRLCENQAFWAKIEIEI